MNKDRRIKVSEAVKEKLVSEQARTGKGPFALLKNRRDQTPPGLTASLISAWVGGFSPTAKYGHIEYVLDSYGALPSVAETVWVADGLSQKISLEKERTGVAATRLLSRASQPIPANLTVSKIISWIGNRTATARADHVQFVLDEYGRLPDGKGKPDSTRRMIAAHEKADFLKYNDLGYLPSLIFEGQTKIPVGLEINVVKRWLYAGAKRAYAEHIDFVLSRCAVLEQEAATPIRISRTMKSQLKDLMAETNCNAEMFFERFSDLPEDLTFREMNLWVYGENSRVIPADWDCVIALYQSLARA